MWIKIPFVHVASSYRKEVIFKPPMCIASPLTVIRRIPNQIGFTGSRSDDSSIVIVG